MKTALIAVAALIIIGGGWWYYSTTQVPAAVTEIETQQPTSIEGGTVVADGTYIVDTAQSKVSWAVGKPLIEGYINSGSIGLKDGTITVAAPTASGTFTIDMDTISVSATPTKPGKESSLEVHLKSDDFFDVAKYPTGSFKITKVEAGAESATTLTYTVTGDLTLKDKTLAISFPAQIYQKDGMVHAHGEFTIDRTKWGLTYNSGTFFDNLANNVIEDEIHLTLSAIATK